MKADRRSVEVADGLIILHTRQVTHRPKVVVERDMKAAISKAFGAIHAR